MKSHELVPSAERIVKELSRRLNAGQIGLQDAEQRIVEFLNWVGDLMVQEVVEGVAEPTRANRIMVHGEVAVFEQVRNLRFINRFGEHVVRPRRCYKLLNQPGSFAPLDAKLGIEGCFGFSPLMTMLICMLGAEEPYERSATKLEALLGYAVSSTAVQRTTEKTGERIPDDPAEVIDAVQRGQPCPLMVVEVDGTTSPQISPLPGVTGRESLRAQTCWKECNLVVIEKRDGKKVTDRWTGARYGPRKDFEPYAAQAGMQMGFMDAEQTLFIADGARHNWELAMTHFPGAVQILDYYHAAGHLAEFCDLLPASMHDEHLRQWSTLLYNGEPLQLIVEMKGAVAKLTDADAGWKHINYFQNNQQRMDYGRYRACGSPIGSGSVEGQCKFVVARRFKGNGMRWRPHDNECVLRTRLAVLNGALERYFQPRPEVWNEAA